MGNSVRKSTYLVCITYEPEQALLLPILQSLTVYTTVLHTVVWREDFSIFMFSPLLKFMYYCTHNFDPINNYYQHNVSTGHFVYTSFNYSKALKQRGSFLNQMTVLVMQAFLTLAVKGIRIIKKLNILSDL
jgi:hypothetical protein